MHHVVDQGRLLPRPDADPGLRGRRQDRHGADLGRRQEGAGRSTCSTTRSSATSRARSPPRPRGRGPDRGGDADRHPARPPRDARDVVRAVPADRPRRDQHPRPRPRGRTLPPASTRVPVTAACATLDRRDGPGRSPIPGSPARPPAPPIRLVTAEDLVGRPAGASSGAAIARSAAGPSTPGSSTPGNLFVALPGERTDGHRFLAPGRRGRRGRAARAAASRVAGEPAARRRWAT